MAVPRLFGPFGPRARGAQARPWPPRAQGPNGPNKLGTAKPGHRCHLGGLGMAAVAALVKAKKRFWAGQNLPPPPCPPHGPKTAVRPFLVHVVGKGTVPTTSPSPPGGSKALASPQLPGLAAKKIISTVREINVAPKGPFPGAQRAAPQWAPSRHLANCKPPRWQQTAPYHWKPAAPAMPEIKTVFVTVPITLVGFYLAQICL